MESAASEVEILVHITAPSTAADDARYRQLASAYLNFRPSHTTGIAKESLPLSSQKRNSLVQSSSDVIKDSFIELGSQDGSMPDLCVPYTPSAGLGSSSPKRSDVIEDSFLASSLPSMPLNGNAAVVSSPRNEEDDDGWPDSSIAIPSSQPRREDNGDGDEDGDGDDDDIIVEVPDSYPTATAAMSKFCTPTRIFEHFYHRMEPVTPDERPAKRPRTEADPPARVSTRDSSDRGPSRVGIGSQEPPRTQRTQERRNGGHVPVPIRRHHSDQGQPRPKTLIPLTRSMSEYFARPNNPPPHLLDNSLEITPPPPPASVDDLDAASLVTPRLAGLVKNLELDRRYRPDYLCPDLQPLDRGYWLVDCSAWDEDTRRQVWGYLANYVRSGCAGWGVWCRRAGAGAEGGDAVVGGWMRAYCWAGVAGHVYLLLHLASQRKLKLVDMSWIGADGEAKIVVSARSDVESLMSSAS